MQKYILERQVVLLQDGIDQLEMSLILDKGVKLAVFHVLFKEVA